MRFSFQKSINLNQQRCAERNIAKKEDMALPNTRSEFIVSVLIYNDVVRKFP
jgi:hypothetical protein